MPKKHSRITTVDGVGFRWRISRKGMYCPCCSSALRFAAELADDPRQVLVVSFPASWPDSGLPGAIPITPRFVAASIREALRRGWEPAQPGSAFVFAVTDDELAVLLGTSPLHDMTAAASA